MNNLLLITTTIERKEDAERIATLLLVRRLVACAQISTAITSIYRWRGKVTTASELVLSLKTLPQHYTLIEQLLLQEHPYETPEIIAQEIPLVSKAYSDWVKQEVL
ncbi:MAG: divalent-cation tolerance protein CutA [Proteobacteria bacterium]|nr:divalent-cation tolerance protein CutA [Pseudomonadota bacterium]